jgi:hypothetical protein
MFQPMPSVIANANPATLSYSECDWKSHPEYEGIYSTSGLPDLICSLVHAMTRTTLAENNIFVG